jgi:spore maturation protein CgeB
VYYDVHDKHDLTAKLRYYLLHPEGQRKAEEIAIAGYKHAMVSVYGRVCWVCEYNV